MYVQVKDGLPSFLAVVDEQPEIIGILTACNIICNGYPHKTCSSNSLVLAVLFYR